MVSQYFELEGLARIKDQVTIGLSDEKRDNGSYFSHCKPVEIDRVGKVFLTVTRPSNYDDKGEKTYKLVKVR